MWFMAALSIVGYVQGMRFDRNNVVAIGEENSAPMQQGFMDSIYGELVHSQESLQYKQGLVDSGEVRIHSAQQEPEIDLNLDNIDLQDYLTHQTKYHRMAAENAAAKSHQSYLKYQSNLKLPEDDDTEDLVSLRNLFGGIITFGGLEHFSCFSKSKPDSERDVDIAIVGAPFDTGVSYRPGARFGPEGIRLGARRIGGTSPVRTNGNQDSKLSHINPYDRSSHNLTIIDCGDVPLTPFDNRVALNQLYRGERAIHSHPTKNKVKSSPKIITMGGDHTITLMTLKLAYEKYGPVNVIHFDSHIDTWNPKVLGGGISNYMKLNHGTFLHYAAEQGYLNKTGCFHVGLRAPYIDGEYDPEHDKNCGFDAITARQLDHLGIRGVVNKLLHHIGTEAPVYISVDIDVLDPAFAPATGTMEVGGWSSRELISVLDGLEGINLVGADVVEVSPPFDSNSEITSLAATAVIDSFLGLMIVKELYY